MSPIEACSKENGVVYGGSGDKYIRCNRTAVRWFWCPKTGFVSSSCQPCLDWFKDKLHWVRGDEVTRAELEVLMVMWS